MFICIGHNLPPCRSVYAEARVPNFRFGAAIVIENCAIGRIFQSFLLCGCQKRLYGSFLLFPILPFMPRPVHLIKKIHKCAASIRFADGGRGWPSLLAPDEVFPVMDGMACGRNVFLACCVSGRGLSFPLRSPAQKSAVSCFWKAQSPVRRLNSALRASDNAARTDGRRRFPKARASPMHRRSVSMP